MSYGIKTNMNKKELLEVSLNIEHFILSDMILEAGYDIHTDNKTSIQRDALLDYVQSVIKNLSEED